MKKNQVGSKIWGKHGATACIFCWMVGGWMCFFFAHSDFRVDRIPELREENPSCARKKSRKQKNGKTEKLKVGSEKMENRKYLK